MTHNDFDRNRAWNQLQTPVEWHEEVFVPSPEEYYLPLWVTLLAGVGCWALGYYVVVLMLFLWGMM